MAPLAPFPAEIDLFTVPHSRMKELVSKYTLKVQDADYRNYQEVCCLLKELQMTLHEFKSHEFIENMFIMDQLKNRLKQNHIYNSAVCDCHNDNRLQEMLTLVKSGRKIWKTSIGERLHYGSELQKAFSDFVQQFLPHMEEEENIFQPLLVEHFGYDELKVIKQVVLEQHELIKDPQYQEKAELVDTPERDSAIKEFGDLDSSECCLSSLYDEENVPNISENDFSFPDECPENLKLQDECSECLTVQDECLVSSKPFHKCLESLSIQGECLESLEPLDDYAGYLKLQDGYLENLTPLDECLESLAPLDECLGSLKLSYEAASTCGSFQQLPTEILITIFEYLDPPDRGRCAQVCSMWNDVVYSPILWKDIYPVQWSRGLWEWKDLKLSYSLKDEGTKEHVKADEDADVDESEYNLDPLSQKENDFFSSILTYLLPRIGQGVENVVLDGGQGVSPRLLHRCLSYCPNVIRISATYTFFDYYTLKSLRAQTGLRKLRYLDLEGCENMDDKALAELASCLLPANLSSIPEINRCRKTSSCPSRNSGNSLSNCQQKDGHCRCRNAGKDKICQKKTTTRQSNDSRLYWNKNFMMQLYDFEIEELCNNGHQEDNFPGNFHHDNSLYPHGQQDMDNYPGNFHFYPHGQDMDLDRAEYHQGDSFSLHGQQMSNNRPAWDIPSSYDFQEIDNNHGDSFYAHGQQARTDNNSDSHSHPVFSQYNEPSLLTINLSGCWRCTNVGLLALVNSGCLKNVSSINLSSCFNLSGESLLTIAKNCVSLRPENLTYCNNITDGPYVSKASGCDSLDHPLKVCCRSNFRN